MIIAGTLNFKIAALHFVNDWQELINAIEQTTIVISTKFAITFGVHFYEVFAELSKQL